MATIDRKPLPPPNSSVTTVAEADRAEMVAHAKAVIDYYLNGPGSYWDAGTRKPLVSDDEFREADTTVNDLKKFKDRVIAAKQFADDPGLVMDSIIALIDQTTQKIEDAARYSEGRSSIRRLPPDTNDPIDDPRVISPRALNNAAMPIVFEGGQRTAPMRTGEPYESISARPVRILSRMTVGRSPTSNSASDFGEMAVRRSDAQNIRGLSTRSMPGGDARNDDVSSLGIPDPSVSPFQSNPPFGLLAEKPMSQRTLPPSVFGFSNRSGTPGSDVTDRPVAMVGVSRDRSPDRQSTLGDGIDRFFADVPAGLAGRIAAAAGIQPADTDPRTLQENGLYNDSSSRPWLLRALTGRV